MKNILNWFQVRKQQIKYGQYVSGYNYALGTIARGEKTPLELDAEQYDAPRNMFDVGMDNAIDYAVQYGLVKDNRIY